jgi:hypothetical protein
MEIPEGYDHKATSESFNGAERVSVYYNKVAADYLVVVGGVLDEEQGWIFNKTQLELIVHAGTDVLDDAKV